MSKLNLHDLSRILIQRLLPAAALRQNLLVNDIPASIYFQGDRKLALTVVNGLLSGSIAQVGNSCIRVTAKAIGEMILICVTDGKGYNDCGIIEGVMEEYSVTEKDASIVSITKNQWNTGGFFNSAA